MAEAIVTFRVPENLASTSGINQAIPIERLESQVSTDAVPWTPTHSVPFGETPACECAGNIHPGELDSLSERLGKPNVESFSMIKLYVE